MDSFRVRAHTPRTPLLSRADAALQGTPFRACEHDLDIWGDGAANIASPIDLDHRLFDLHVASQAEWELAAGLPIAAPSTQTVTHWST